MSSRRWIVSPSAPSTRVVAVVAALLLASSVASAQSKPKPTVRAGARAAAAAPATPPSLSESLKDDAKADYESGKVLFGDGDHAGALVKFATAYDKAHDARLLWNMAACEKNLRHYARALALVSRYASEGGALLTEQDRKDAADLIHTLEPFTTALTVDVSEPDADVYVDDEKVGRTPLAAPVVVDVGSRHIRVAKDGFKDQTVNVAIGGTATAKVAVALERVLHQGTLEVSAPEGSSVSLDGKTVGVGRFTGVVASGGHTLKVTAKGMRPHQTEVLIQDGQTRHLDVTLEKEPSAPVPTWVWITGGAVLVAGAAVGGYFLFFVGEDGDLSHREHRVGRGRRGVPARAARGLVVIVVRGRALLVIASVAGAVALGAASCVPELKFADTDAATPSDGGADQTAGQGDGASPDATADGGGDGTAGDGGGGDGSSGDGGADATADAFPTTRVLDDFNRANGPLDAGWYGPSGLFVESNQLAVHVVGGSSTGAWNTAFLQRQEAYITLVSPPAGKSYVLFLHAYVGSGETSCNGFHHYIAANIDGTGSVFVSTCESDGGTISTPDAGSGPAIFAAGQTFGVRVLEDGRVTLYRDATAVLTVPLTSPVLVNSAGQIGFFTTSDGVILDDFGGGSVP